MCYADLEASNHLLTQCSVALRIWNYFGQLLEVCCSPTSLRDLWGAWRTKIKKALIPFCDLRLRAITWNNWIEINACIFTSTCSPTATIIVKIVHMVLMWLNAVPDSKKAKLEEPMGKLKRSLEFLTSRDTELSAPVESITSQGEG